MLIDSIVIIVDRLLVEPINIRGVVIDFIVGFSSLE